LPVAFVKRILPAKHLWELRPFSIPQIGQARTHLSAIIRHQREPSNRLLTGRLKIDSDKAWSIFDDKAKALSNEKERAETEESPKAAIRSNARRQGDHCENRRLQARQERPVVCLDRAEAQWRRRSPVAWQSMAFQIGSVLFQAGGTCAEWAGQSGMKGANAVRRRRRTANDIEEKITPAKKRRTIILKDIWSVRTAMQSLFNEIRLQRWEV
jgi:hypothetical protein